MRIIPFAYMQESNITPPPPYVVTTGTIGSVTYNYARMEGSQVLSGGGATVTARGVIWSLGTPTVNLTTKTVNGSGLGIFGSDINVYGQRTWNVRAYATNSNSITSYGETTSFYAPAGPPLPYAFVFTQGTNPGGDWYVVLNVGLSANEDSNYTYGYIWNGGSQVATDSNVNVLSGTSRGGSGGSAGLSPCTEYSYQGWVKYTGGGPTYYTPVYYITTEGC